MMNNSEFDDILDDFHMSIMRIKQLKQQVTALVAALEEDCEYHHLELINGWAHNLSGKTIRCRLSEKAKQALALAEVTKVKGKE